MKPAWTTAASPDNALPAHLLAVLDGWQRGFPLVPRPYAAIARANGLDERDLLTDLSALLHNGILGRVGATIRPNTVGVSMLAAMEVPPERLDEVARIVNAEPGVNHNYEREHVINLWFVISAQTASELAAALDRIRAASGLDIIELPLERSYFIDLGFSLQGVDNLRNVHKDHMDLTADRATPSHVDLDETDRRVLGAIEQGLMLVPRPYHALGQQTGMSEGQAIARIERLIALGVITRFGLIVRHRRLGYRANAMVVFDIDNSHVDEIGARFARQPFVTLCYRRPRHGLRWPYNLFCMIHGRDRARVLEQVHMLTGLGVQARRHAILFSRRCYLQRGTRTASSSLPAQEAAQ